MDCNAELVKELSYTLNCVMGSLLDEFQKPKCKLSKVVRQNILGAAQTPATSTMSEAECEPFAFRERLNALLV